MLCVINMGGSNPKILGGGDESFLSFLRNRSKYELQIIGLHFSIAFESGGGQQWSRGHVPPAQRRTAPGIKAVWRRVFFKENLQLHNFAFIPSPSLPSPSLPPSPPLPLLSGVRGITPGKIFGIRDARRWVLEHFGHKIQHRYEPGF